MRKTSQVRMRRLPVAKSRRIPIPFAAAASMTMVLQFQIRRKSPGHVPNHVTRSLVSIAASGRPVGIAVSWCVPADCARSLYTDRAAMELAA